MDKVHAEEISIDNLNVSEHEKERVRSLLAGAGKDDITKANALLERAVEVFGDLVNCDDECAASICSPMEIEKCMSRKFRELLRDIKNRGKRDG